MSTCATDRGAALLALALLLIATPAAADEWRGEGTLGVRYYELDPPFDNDDLSSFYDQYRYIRTKNADVPIFADLLHLDLGLFREDDTHRLRLERISENWLNERGRLDVDWRGLDLGLDYQRYRSDSLRLFPTGTGGSVPVFGTLFNPDAPPVGDDRRLYVRRNHLGGELRLRGDGFGRELPWLDELRLLGRNETRKGWRQDRFLLDSGREIGAGGVQTARFRGNRRELDQEIKTTEAALVLTPWKGVTASIRGGFEKFREDAPVVLLSDLAFADPGIGGGFSQAQALRAFNFVPDTDRTTGSLRLSGRAGSTSYHVGGYYTRLAQAGRRAPLQRFLGLEDVDVTTWSAQGGFDAPLPGDFGLNGFAKFVRRRNDLDTASFDAIATGSGQSDPFLHKRLELTGGLEATLRPTAGSVAAAGYRLRWLDLDRRFSSGSEPITPAVALQADNAETHTVYLRGVTRLLRSLRLSGELGYEWSPEVEFARDLESAVYGKGRGSYSWVQPFPLTLSVHGRARHGDNDDTTLRGQTPGSGRRKHFERTAWSYGLSLSALPGASTTLFGSFLHDRDDQEFAHVRSNIPRYGDPALLEFFLDSRPDYESEVRSLTLGGRQQLSESFEASVASTLTWVSADFASGGNTAAQIDAANEIRQRITSVELDLGYRARPGLRFGLGYRFDHFRDRRDLETLNLDDHVQTFTLSVTLDLNPED